MILTISQKLLRKRVSLIHSAQPAIYIYANHLHDGIC